MRVSLLDVREFFGIKRAELAIDEATKIVAFVGSNAQGKTMFLEALLFALTGQIRGGLTKAAAKDYLAGAVEAVLHGPPPCEPISVSRTLQSSTVPQNALEKWIGAGTPVVRACLEPRLYALHPQERRKVISEALQLHPSQEDLDRAEIRDQTVRSLVLQGSVKAAFRAVQQRRREAQQLSQQALGSPPEDVQVATTAGQTPISKIDPAMLRARISGVRADITQLESAAHTAELAARAVQRLKDIDAEVEEIGEVEEKAAKLENEATEASRATIEAENRLEEIATDRKNAGERAARFEKLRGMCGREDCGLPSPSSHQSAFSEKDEADQRAVVEELRAAWNGAQDLAGKARGKASRRKALLQERETIATYASGDQATGASELRSRADELREQVNSLERLLTRAEAFRAERKAYDGNEARLGALKAKASELATMEEALGPKGALANIMGERLRSVQGVFDEIQACRVIWEEDGSLSIGGRHESLASASERWRAASFLQILCAEASGVRLTLLDEFAVLDPTVRRQTLEALAHSQRIDQAWIGATLTDEDIEALRVIPHMQMFLVKDGGAEAV